MPTSVISGRRYARLPSSRAARSSLSLLLLSGILLAGASTRASQSDTGPVFKAGSTQLLSVGSPTKDEDPSVLRARNGKLFVAWFSDRGGNADIYITSTINGEDWTPPVRVTSSPEGDFYPNLFQDEKGTFHLVWFRWRALYRGNIWHNSSPDGLTWDQGAEVQVTSDADVDDWVPTITQAVDGTLLVYFVSGRRDGTTPVNEIFVAARRPTAPGWDPAVRHEGINSTTQHNHLPFAVRIGDKIALVWVRHDTRNVLPWENPKSDIFYSTSSDGFIWSAPTKITNESGDVANLFPALYASLDDEWSIVWLSAKGGSPKVFEIPFSDAALYPAGRVKNKKMSAGYSHRIAATSTPGIYLGVWAEGPEGAQEIYYRFFKRKR